MRLVVLLFISVLFSNGEGGVQAAPKIIKEQRSKCHFDQTHSAWGKLLQKYVSNGLVDYKHWQNGVGRVELKAYLSSLETVCPDIFAKWTKAQKLSYWINVYNAYTVELILEHYPVKSIRKIWALPFGIPSYAPFNKAWIPIKYLGKEKLTLMDVENEIIRKEFKEPRIHFAINCASFSCPKLQSEAFVAAKLDKQLHDATVEFLSDSSKNRLNVTKRKFYLSKIFDWYKEDFGETDKSIIAFVLKHLPKKLKAPFEAPPGLGVIVMGYLPYDWKLNEQK